MAPPNTHRSELVWSREAAATEDGRAKIENEAAEVRAHLEGSGPVGMELVEPNRATFDLMPRELVAAMEVIEPRFVITGEPYVSHPPELG